MISSLRLVLAEGYHGPFRCIPACLLNAALALSGDRPRTVDAKKGSEETPRVVVSFSTVPHRAFRQCSPSLVAGLTIFQAGRSLLARSGSFTDDPFKIVTPC